jgi:putative sigma-54 modulation protein
MSMQIKITGRHFDISDAVHEFVHTKFKKLERHFDHITQVHVILTVEKKRQMAEATVHTSGADLFAEAESENMYTSIDMTVDKLDRQLIKHKDKLKDHSGASKVKAAAEASGE